MEVKAQTGEIPLPEQPLEPVYPVDEPATLFLLRPGMAYSGRMVELGAGGCQLRLNGDLNTELEVPAEVSFRIRGIAFRVPGKVASTTRPRTIGISFGAMSERRRSDLSDVLAELASGAPEAVRPPASGAALATAVTRVPVSGPAPAVTQPAARVQTLRTPAVATGRDAVPRIAHPVKNAPASPAARNNGRDRRSQMRHAVDSSAVIFLLDVRSRISGRILDVSLSGCRIRSQDRFPVGIFRRVEVEFTVDGLPFRLPGVVQSLHDHFTIGIRFLDLSERKVEQLTELAQELAEARASGQQG